MAQREAPALFQEAEVVAGTFKQTFSLFAKCHLHFQNYVLEAGCNDRVTMVPWKSGRSLVWDVTDMPGYLFCSFIVALATSKAGAVATHAEESKVHLHHLQSLPYVCPSGH